MFNNEILTTGEKIKKMRKLLGLTQSDICGGFNRSNIVLAEKNGKMSDNLIQTIIDIFNSKLSEYNSKKQITKEWLQEDVDVQAERIIDDYIKDLKLLKLKHNQTAIINHTIIIVNNILKKFTLQEKTKIKLFIIISDSYFLIFEYNNSKKYALEALVLLVNINNSNEDYVLMNFQINVFLNLIKCFFQLNQQQDVFNYIETIINRSKRWEIKTSKALRQIYYYAALSHYKMKDIVNCLYCIDLIEDVYPKRHELYFEVAILKAECYITSNRLIEAEILYDHILKESIHGRDSDIIAWTYMCLAKINLKRNDINKCETYINKALEFKTNINYESKLLNEAISLSIKITNSEFIQKNYIRAIKLNADLKDEKMQYKIISNIFYYFTINIMDHALIEFMDNIYDKIINGAIMDIRMGYLFNSAQEYFKIENPKQSDIYFEKSIKVQNILLNKYNIVGINI